MCTLAPVVTWREEAIQVALRAGLHRLLVSYGVCQPFSALPLALGAPVTFARLSRASFMSHLLAPPPCRAGPSPWFALWYGMISHWLSGHFLEYSPRNSFSNLKQHYSAALGLGALLSSPT